MPAKKTLGIRVLLCGMLTVSTLFLSCPSVVAQDTSEYQSVTREYYRRLGVWVVPATMAEKNGLAMLATGSNVVCVNAPNGMSDFPDQVLLPKNSASQSNVFAGMPFSCLGLQTQKGLALGMTLTSLQESTHIPILALAGVPYLRQNAIRLDPATGCIDVLPKVEETADGVELEIRWEKDLPAVSVELPVLGRRSFIIDTGCWGYLEMEADRVKALERMGHIIVRSVGETIHMNLVTGNKTTTASKDYILRWLEFGGIRFHNVPLKIQPTDRIGLGLLHCFRTTLDFPGDRVCLERLTTDHDVVIPRPSGGASMGFHDSDRLVVDYLLEDSSAQRLGIEMGDRVLSLDGLSPPELSRHKIDEILSQTGKTLSLDLQRGDRRFQVDLNLDHPFPWPPAWEPELPTFDPDAETVE